jgi:hypothetical protein
MSPRPPSPPAPQFCVLSVCGFIFGAGGLGVWFQASDVVLDSAIDTVDNQIFSIA